MGIPSLGERHDAQNYWLRRMEKQHKDTIEFVYPEIYVGRLFHDCARNAYVEQFLDSDCDILFFLDSDIIPPERLFDLVLEHGSKWDLAGAPYPVWMQQEGFDGPQVTFTVYTDRGQPGKLWPAPIPEQGLDMVSGIATGCIFIRRTVLEKMSKPYFEFKYDPLTRQMLEGEDLGFCRKVNELGFKFFVDYTMLCHHYKRVSLLDVSNAIEAQKQIAVDANDRVYRQAIAKMKLKELDKPKAKKKSNLILPDSYK